MPTVPIPPDVFEEFCEESPEMAAQVIKQLHDSAQRERQKRLDEEAEDES
jgi:CRP-like cAMP-binding protein